MTKHSRMRRREGAASLGAIVLAVLVPKCPFCVAAWLTAFGVGGVVSLSIAPFVKPSIYVLVAVTLAMSVRGLLRRDMVVADGSTRKGDRDPRACCRMPDHRG